MTNPTNRRIDPDKLAKMLDGGASMGECARSLGVSIQAVSQFLGRRGHKPDTSRDHARRVAADRRDTALAILNCGGCDASDQREAAPDIPQRTRRARGPA